MSLGGSHLWQWLVFAFSSVVMWEIDGCADHFTFTRAGCSIDAFDVRTGMNWVKWREELILFLSLLGYSEMQGARGRQREVTGRADCDELQEQHFWICGEWTWIVWPLAVNMSNHSSHLGTCAETQV